MSPAERAVYVRYRALYAQYVDVAAQMSRLALAATAPSRQAAIRLYVTKAGPLDTGLDALAVQLVTINDAQATADAAKIDSSAASSKTLTIIVLLLAVLFGVGLSVAMSRSIKRAVVTILSRIRSLQDAEATHLKEGIEALASGDLTVDVHAVTAAIENPANDEIGQVGRAVNGIRDRFAATIDAYNRSGCRDPGRHHHGRPGRRERLPSHHRRRCRGGKDPRGVRADRRVRRGHDVPRIEQIAAASQQITASAMSMQENITEVAAVAEQSSASTKQVSASTEETTASAEEIAASAQTLAGDADELNRLVAQFKTAA